MSKPKEDKKQNKEIDARDKIQNKEKEEHYTIDYEEISPDRIDKIIKKIKIGENLSFFD